MNKHDNDSEYLGITEAAEYLRVSASTLRRWEKKGFLIPERTPTGIRRYTKKQLDFALVSDPQVSSFESKEETYDSIVSSPTRQTPPSVLLPDIEPLDDLPADQKIKDDGIQDAANLSNSELFYKKDTEPVVVSPVRESNFVSVTPKQDISGFDFAKLLKDAELPEFNLQDNPEPHDSSTTPFSQPISTYQSNLEVVMNPSPANSETKIEPKEDVAYIHRSEGKKRSRLMMGVVFSLALLSLFAVFIAFFWYFNSSSPTTELLNPVVN